MTYQQTMVEVMAQAIHRAMCYRGKQSPTCNSDKGDAILVLEELAKKDIYFVKEVRS